MIDKIRAWLSKHAAVLLYLVSTIALTVIEKVILHFYSSLTFGFTTLAIVIILLKIGGHIFGKAKGHTGICLGCSFANIAIINGLYTYDKIVETFPLLSGINQWIILGTAAGTALAVTGFIKVISWLLQRPGETPRRHVPVGSPTPETPNPTREASTSRTRPVYSQQEPASAHERGSHRSPIRSSTSAGGGNDGEQTSRDAGKTKYSNLHDTLFSIAILAIVLSVVFFGVYYLIKNVQQYNLSTFTSGIPNSILIIFSYGILAAVGLVITGALVVILFELLLFMRPRIIVMFRPLREDEMFHPLSTNVLSVAIVLVMFGLMYFNKNITLTDFFDFAVAGDYLALPLELLVMLGLFLFLTVCVNWFLKALTEPHSDDPKSSFHAFDAIKQEIIGIIKTSIDLVIDTAKTALDFVGFVPDFFSDIYDFVFADEYDVYVEDVCAKRDKDNMRTASAQPLSERTPLSPENPPSVEETEPIESNEKGEDIANENPTEENASPEPERILPEA